MRVRYVMERKDGGIWGGGLSNYVQDFDSNFSFLILFCSCY